MKIHDPELDNLTAAQHTYQRLVEGSAIKFDSIRDKPCQDCAVTSGMYHDYALSCAKYLSKAECQTAASHWDCHNGGRCEGAAAILLGEKITTLFRIHSITGSHALTKGQLVYEAVVSALNSGESVILDFAGVEVCWSTFLSEAIAQLIKDFPPEVLNDLLTIENMAQEDRRTLKIAIENVKRQLEIEDSQQLRQVIEVGGSGTHKTHPLQPWDVVRVPAPAVAGRVVILSSGSQHIVSPCHLKHCQQSHRNNF